MHAGDGGDCSFENDYSSPSLDTKQNTFFLSLKFKPITNYQLLEHNKLQSPWVALKSKILILLLYTVQGSLSRACESSAGGLHVVNYDRCTKT